MAERIQELESIDALIDYALPFSFAIAAVHEATSYMMRAKSIAFKRKIGIGVGYRWGDSINLGYLSDAGFSGGAGRSV